MAKTPRGLPVVQEGLLESLMRDVISGSFSCRDLLNRIAGDGVKPGENSLVATYVETLLQMLPEEGDERNLALSYMLGLYELLERQAEADKMNEMYGE